MLVAVVVVLAFGVGCFFQTIAGFGSALIIMPILTLFIGPQPATTVMALASALVTVTILYQNRRGLRWGEAARLLSGSAIGIPIGVWALKRLPGAYVVAFLGLVLVAYSIYTIVSQRKSAAPAIERAPRSLTLRDKIITWFVGFSAGLLGGAYATDGPPLVVYGAIKKWPKESFRSILQACFLVDGIVILACLGAGGLITREVVTFSIYAIPGMLMGLVLGTILDRKINHAVFHRLLTWLILLLGAALIARAAFMP
jgi:uncharacterized protein